MILPNYKESPTLEPAQNSTLTLADIVATVESRKNRYAMRYEPAWRTPQQLAPTIARLNVCNIATALEIGRISWGAFQVMASNLYYMGLDCSIGQFLSDDEKQKEMFVVFCKRRQIEFTLDDILDDDAKGHLFALHYNGAPGPYLLALRDAYEREQDKIEKQ